MWKKIWNPSNRKVFCLNIVTAFVLDIFLEYIERGTFSDLFQFMNERTFVFLYNALIIFVSLSLVFLAKKKLFTYAVISGGWLLVGIANGIVLSGRKTPFTAVDLTLAKSILPIIRSYLSMWQIVMVVILLVAAVILMVCLYLYSPVARKSFHFKVNAVMVLLLFVFFAGITFFGTGKGQLISKFDNLIAGYQDYGVAYGFCVTALDTGIDRPIDYSRNRVKTLKKKVQSKMDKLKAQEDPEKSKNPNIIFIQLESFFDLTTVKNLEISKDPVPTLHWLQKEYTSGNLKVPVYGAGTINTEFEVITGMNTEFFGTGEYPYRSVLQNKVCDSISYWLKEKEYQCSVVHNNNASFYDRDTVFSNLGFDRFVTIENMNVRSRNEAGWTKDSILTENIMNLLSTTKEKDLIYAISVQGHGDYPTSGQEDAEIQVSGEHLTKGYQNQLTYYANQIYEMDDFIKELLDKLSDYPEDVMVIAYGDHLPGMNFENEDLINGSKYETPYFIWDNFGYNQKAKEKESGDVAAYALASKVLSQVNIDNGFLNQYHQTMRESNSYQKNLKLLQYDMLYGSDFIREGSDELEPTELKFSIEEVKINRIKENEGQYLLLGDNFTDASRVYVNGIQVNSKVKSNHVIELLGASLKDGDAITVHQVSVTNENITLNQSEAYEFSHVKVEPLYKTEE